MMTKQDRFSIAIFSKYVFREIRQYVIRPTNYCLEQDLSFKMNYHLVEIRKMYTSMIWIDSL